MNTIDQGTTTNFSPSSTLALEQSIPLTAVLCVWAAEEAGARILIIKGPAAEHYRQRASRVSSDIDVYADPLSTEIFQSALSRRGWKRRPIDTSDIWPVHSFTYFHSQWPNDIDVHFRFPGFDESSQNVFEQIYSQHNLIKIAGQPVPIPSELDSWIIQGLHAARSYWEKQSHDDLALLRETQPLDGKTLTDRARQLGCTAALYPHFSEDLLSLSAQERIPSDEWRLRMAAQNPGAARILVLRSSPWSQWPSLLKKALFRTREQLASEDLRLMNASQSELFRVRIRRWVRFATSLMSKFQKRNK
jgi:hypothetical protein